MNPQASPTNSLFIFSHTQIQSWSRHGLFNPSPLCFSFPPKRGSLSIASKSYISNCSVFKNPRLHLAQKAEYTSLVCLSVENDFTPRDFEMMKRCIELAQLGKGQTRPNPMVGCVIVDDNGVIVGEGFHPKAGKPHAEVYAIRSAGHLTKDATAYVSLEPCNHFGRTPPCSQGLIAAGIKTVYVGTVDPDPRTAGKGVQTLRDAGIKVYVGLLQRECQLINEGFFRRIQQGLPFGIYKYAMTLDGKIATDQGSSRWVSGPESRKRVHGIRAGVDGIIVGGNTLRRDNPQLTVRENPEGALQHVKDAQQALGSKIVAENVLSEHEVIAPIRVVMTRSLHSLPLDAKLWDTSNTETVVITGKVDKESEKEETVRAIITSKGVKVLECKSATPSADEVMRRLYELDALEVLWECGGTLAVEALQKNAIQKICAFIAPKLVGGTRYSPLGFVGIESMDKALKLTDVTYEQIGQDLFLQGYLRPTDQDDHGVSDLSDRT